jgi:L-amino acid N-acyltransferase YncA
MVRVRKAVLSDLPLLLDIYNDAIRNLTATFDLEEQTMNERKIWFEKFDEKHPLIVAELENDEVVGYSCLSAFRAKPAYAYSTELSVYISSNQRGKGIGSVLLQAILHQAVHLGYHTVIGGITEGNAVSIRLHEKFGFEYIGCFREVGLKFGQWQDVHFYQLLITENREVPQPG